MIDADALRAMAWDELLAWLLRRARGEENNPPVCSMHGETPEDFVLVVHECADGGFRERLRTVVGVALLTELDEQAYAATDLSAAKRLAEAAAAMLRT